MSNKDRDERDKPGLRQDLTALIDSAKREELEYIKRSITGTSSFYPLYCGLDREGAVDTCRKVAIGFVDERLAQLEQSEESK